MTDVGTSSETDTNAEAGASVAADLKAVAGQKLDEAVAGVKTKAEDAKASVAGEVDNMASVLRKAAHEMRDGSPQERSIAFVASGLADASEAIRDKDLGEMLQSVNRVARRNPFLFLGGAALVGFAASRYLKATGSGHGSGWSDDYATGGGYGYRSGGAGGGSPYMGQDSSASGYMGGDTSRSGYMGGQRSGSGYMGGGTTSSGSMGDDTTSSGYMNDGNDDEDDLNEGKPNDPSVTVFP